MVSEIPRVSVFDYFPLYKIVFSVLGSILEIHIVNLPYMYYRSIFYNSDEI